MAVTRDNKAADVALPVLFHYGSHGGCAFSCAYHQSAATRCWLRQVLRQAFLGADRIDGSGVEVKQELARVDILHDNIFFDNANRRLGCNPGMVMS